LARFNGMFRRGQITSGKSNLVRRLGYALASAAGLLVLTAALLSFFDAPIWEVRYIVDLNSGRKGEERLFFGEQVEFDSHDTAVSVAAGQAGWISKTPNWRQYRRHSHFAFFARMSASEWDNRRIEDAIKAWNCGAFSPESKRESARRFLRTEPWGSYAIQIAELADSHPKGSKPVELSDLPPISVP
jgi:dsDNA-binding SOS-regulon protein